MTAMTRCLDRPGFMPRLSAHHLLRPRLAELVDSMRKAEREGGGEDQLPGHGHSFQNGFGSAPMRRWSSA